MKKVLSISLALLSLGLLTNTANAQSLKHTPVGSSITMNVQAVVSNYPPFGGSPTATLQSFYFPATTSTQPINNFSGITSVLTSLNFDINLSSGTYTIYLGPSDIINLNANPNTFFVKPFPSGVPCNLNIASDGNNNFTFGTLCY